MTARTLRGAAAIVGVADAVSPTGELDRHGRALEADDGPGALDDAGLDPRRRRRRRLRRHGRWASPSTWASAPGSSTAPCTGGSSFEVHVEHAAAAIAAGLCDVVLGVYAATPRGDRKRRARRGIAAPRRARARTRRSSGSCPTACACRSAPTPSRPAATWPSYGTTPEQLAQIAVEHPAVGGAATPGPLPGPDHRRRRAGLADAVRRRCTCSTAASSPTAPARS